MSRRVIDVAIRSEFRKGFGDVARQMEALTRQLKSVEGLQSSVNKLADKFDRASTYKNATENAKKFAGNQKTVNKSLDEGVKIANRYESAQTKLARSLGALTASQRSGSISNKQRIEAEIGLLNQYIKKTKDLSVLDSRKTYRGAKGQFTAFTKDALRNVSDSLAKATETGLRTGSQKGATQLVQQMRATTARIKTAVGAITASGYQASFSNRGQQAGFYDAVWGSQGKRNGAGLGTQDLINRTAGVRPANAQTGLMLGEDTKFNQLKLQYQQLEQKAQRTSSRIARFNFGPSPSMADAGFKKLFDNYNRLGHFLFQLQYSTMTIFGLSGIGMIMNQADAYITLRNQVARTSDSINDLGANMQDVYAISLRTFSDPKNVGKLYSTINKYSEDLGLSREGVGSLTGSISGAFAASPGNAGEKAASQYQFVQAFQSNRLGGDELRSVLEMAPYVGDIIAKNLGKVRPGIEGTADLRALAGEPGKAVTARELAQIFQLPEVSSEIKNTLGNQARTFGDMLQAGKVRLMQMTEQFTNSTGIFQQLINRISTFILDDAQWAKFTSALETATTALLVYGTMVTTQAAYGKVAGAVSAFRRGGLAEGAYGPGLNAFQRAGVNAGRQMNGIAAIPGAVASGASAGLNGVTAAVGRLGTASKGAGGLVGAAGRGIGSVFAGIANGIKSLFRFSTLTAIFRGLLTGLNFVAAAFTGLSLPLVVIAAIIGALIMRFNSLLGAMSGGMNVIDILKGTWNMLVDTLSRVGSWVKNSFLGDILSGVIGFIDGILKFLGRQAMGNEYFRQAQADRMYGGNDGKFGVGDGTGRVYEGTLNATGQYTFATDRNGNRIQMAAGSNADVINGQTARANQPNLPSGQKSNLPNTVNTGKDKNGGGRGQKDPWPEFIRDLTLKIQNALDLRDVVPALRDMRQQLNDNLRRAMDTMNFDSSGFATLREAWTAFSDVEGAKATEVNRLNTRLRRLRMAEAMDEFMDSMQDMFADAHFERKKSGTGQLAGQRLDNRRDLINRYLESPSFGRASQSDSEIMEARRGVRQMLSEGNLDEAQRLLSRGLRSRSRFANDLEERNGISDDVAVNELRDRSRVGQQANNLQIALSNVYGRRRETEEEIGNLVNEQAELTRGLEAEDPLLARINEQYGVLIGQVRERQALEESNRRNYATGLQSALAEYRDGLNDLAGDTSSLFSNALKGIEDGLTSLITTGKMNLSEFLGQMQQEVGRLFVRQILMKPLTGMLDKMFGNMFGMQDQTINANNVFINSTGLGSIMGGAGGLGGSLMSGMGKAASGAGGMFAGFARSAVSMIPGVGPFLAGLFHGGGTVGNASMSRIVNPSVFAGAMRYHTGGTVGMPALGVNEIPAILNRGEKVLTASQYSAMNSGGSSQVFSPNVQVTYHAASNSDGGKGGSEDDAKMMGAMVKSAVDQAIMDYDRRSRRPGSPGYLNNKK